MDDGFVVFLARHRCFLHFSGGGGFLRNHGRHVAGRRLRGRHCRHFHAGHGSRSSTGRMRSTPHQSPGPSAPTPRQAPIMSAGSTSSKRTRPETLPYTNGLVLTGNGPSPAADQLSTPTPPAEASNRPGIIPGMNILEAATTMEPSNTGSGPQAGPSTGGGGRHPSFIFGTRAARKDTPPYFRTGEPSV